MRPRRLSRRSFLQAAGLASVAFASLPFYSRALPMFPSSPPNPVVRFPPQLLIDLLQVGSGWGSNFARIFSRSPRNKVVDYCNLSIANAHEGKHWLGPRALNELLTIATDDGEEPVNRENALGALARAVRAWRKPPDQITDISLVGQPAERIIQLARLLLIVEDHASPGWIADPALMEVQCIPADYSDTRPKLPRGPMDASTAWIEFGSCCLRRK